MGAAMMIDLIDLIVTYLWVGVDALFDLLEKLL
jgi:hypothetical protein